MDLQCRYAWHLCDYSPFPHCRLVRHQPTHPHVNWTGDSDYGDYSSTRARPVRSPLQQPACGPRPPRHLGIHCGILHEDLGRTWASVHNAGGLLQTSGPRHCNPN
ncbi:unnamed protein product [Arctogadus glacialis]